ncbi:DNRLRE domain-containing protein [candidate division KSB1 bacterium]|nr:DNRLRE domain-containing protein [candidate division KSB1 bacterium]
MCKKLIYVLIIAAATLFCFCREQRKMWQPSPTRIGIEPNDDAPVKGGVEASIHFAQDKTLSVEHGGAMSFIKFFMPGFSQVESAVLAMQTKTVRSAGPVSVYKVLNSDWDETQITWNKHPDIGSTPLLTVSIDETNKIYKFDLTNFVRQNLRDGNFYICLCFKADRENTNLSFASVEDYDNLKPRFMVSGMTYVPPPPPVYAPAAFNHPGILITQDQIDFVRAKIQFGKPPWKEAFQKAQQHEYAQGRYRPSPVDTLTRTGFYSKSISRGYRELSADARAVFINAQLWALTDNLDYAQNAINIINAWSAGNKAITGGNDKLTGGTACIQFCNAAELLKHSDSGWSLKDQQLFETWLRKIFWPLLRDFIPAYNGNWDAVIGQGLVSMGIYLDDSFIFDHAVNYYLNGIGNGKMSYYVRRDSTTQETLRDQGHEQMGIGALAGIAEIAWNQGIDLYSTKNNRLLRGVEGTAKRVLETEHRRLPIWESMYNHYHNREGYEMHYTEKILQAPGYRPEGFGRYRGFNTLFFYLSI